MYLRERPFAELTRYIIHHIFPFVKSFLKKGKNLFAKMGMAYPLGSMASRATLAASSEMVQ